ncbi:MAG: hypothetical protein AUI64_06080 [Acidobacteria bacterium 13_1_40CM_2_64_6]|nr:MAG: hypothetical protein AUI64_06080 [Acidobacteria bacterium 13_1_40CM_2_64_6]
MTPTWRLLALERHIEEHRLETCEQLVEGLAAPQRKRRARRLGGARRGGKRLGRALQHELPRRDVVVGSRVDPEKLRVAPNLRERFGVTRGTQRPQRPRRGIIFARFAVFAFLVFDVHQNRFEHVAHVEVVSVALVVKDVAAGDGGA